MKKILAILLCLTALMLGATAEEQTPQPRSWQITLDDITFTVGSDAVVLAPSADLLLGRSDSGLWMQLAVLQGDEPAAGLQIDYAGDVITASAIGAQDALLIEGAEMFLSQYGLTPETVFTAADLLLSGIENGSLDEFAASGMLEGYDMSIDVIVPGREYALTYAEPEASVRAHLTFTPREGENPLRFEDKNPCRYTFREAFPGEGTDIPETLMAGLSALLQDATVRAAAGLLQIQPESLTL